ncbi:MAG: hypothetical protein J6T88_04415 [Bacteroidales bacterium]|nr:hypothetical protein [Bacteroidales bacterium]
MKKTNKYLKISLVLTLLLLPLASLAQTDITSLSSITDMTGSYRLTANVSGEGHTTITGPFTGTLEAAIDPTTNMPYRITDLDAPLFTTLSGTVKNLVIESVAISGHEGNTGAIACTANGAARIYNVGILSGSVGGTGNTGGLVGTLDGTARVVNCYSFATITGGTNVGGIVGNNSQTTTAASINTMVMNCMFYGDITGGSTVSPVFGGNNIANLQGGLNSFNYYAYDELQTTAISNNKYNSALAVEEKYMNRFEFYRLLLNSNKKLAAFYVTGNVADANQMLKWVLETADRTIDNPKPYPILKAQGYYPSIINPDFANAPDSATVGRNHGGKLGRTLSVTISSAQTTGGQTKPAGATITTTSLTLQRTDKDFDRFNYNYDKVQLPYYNDVGTGNYTGNRVVTGWKVTAITAVAGDPYTASNYPTTGITDFPNHNYADRKSSNKDLYTVSKRVFSQGAYFDVPYGVTSITIEPYWAKACYIADPNYDAVYKKDYTGKQNVTQTGTQATPGTTTFNGQRIETTVANALNYISGTLGGYGSTVYDNALVLVGNLHLDGVPSGGGNPFTMMSVDEDNDHEPDYSLIYHHKGRTSIAPIRFDFLNIPGTAQAQKPNTASLICNFTIVKTKGWFETTNTALFYTSQFEYENLDGNTKTDAPLILLGGVIDQFVSTQSKTVTGKTIYIHVGGNVWIKEFGMGTHSDGKESTPHVPVSVTGGEFPGFYLTGTYKADATVRSDNAECYISGGYIHEAAGASLEQINGNVRWQIYNADIDNFFGGGINDAKPITGDITTDIYNSHVTLFCGGPKFGDMQTDKTVTTNAEGCVFGTYFGAGYGGTSLSKKKYYDLDSYDWNTLQGYYTTDRGKYFNGTTTGAAQQNGKDYGKKGPGVATDFDYEFFVWTSGTTGARFYVKFASFSLAQCNDVSSTLKKCTINENFYGGGNLGKVAGNATSVLEDCTVNGNVYGAGYSASLPTVEVRDAGFTQNPNYNQNSGMFEPGVFSGTTTFTWQNATKAGKTLTNNQSGSDLTNHILYTNADLTTLGRVMGDVSLTITGTSHILGDVYGGGALSDANTDANNSTNVNILDGTYNGNIYGGGEGSATVAAKVNGVVTVNIGAIDGGGAISGNATLTSSSVFGCNNTNGSPQADVFVNIYKTAQQNGVNTVDDAGYAIDKVFGGGNEAGYDPLGTGTYKTTVHIFTCDNTISQVYGGGNAADAEEVTTIIDGGRFDWVYGGGNGVSRAANIIGDMTLLVDGGTFNHLLNGSNTQGTIGGSINATITNESGCGTGEDFVQEYFCGNNEAPIGSIETPGSITTNILCNPLKAPAHIANLYGGSNRAIIYGDVTLNINGGLIDNVFGGSKGVVGSGADITGNVTLNLYGGTIGNAFGGCDVEGNIDGIITVNVFENSDCPLSIENVYGGGRDASYTPTTAKVGAAKEVPRVNILKGTVNNDVYGGGLGTGATVAGNPQVVTGRKVESVEYRCIIGGNVFGGGSKAQVSGDTRVVILNKTIIKGNVYGGGNEAEITGDTQVILNASSPE